MDFPQFSGMGPVPLPEIDETTDTWTFEERAKIIRWYELTHGTGDSRYNQWVPFMVDYAPGGMKRFNGLRSAIMPSESIDDAPTYLTGAVDRCIFYLHLYACRADARGCLRVTIMSRRTGFSKQQILDVLNYSFLTAGSFGINAVADLCSVYLASWEDDRLLGTVKFPEEWEIDPDAFKSGIDPYSKGMTQGEADSLGAWHRKIAGKVPRYVDLWTRLRGPSYKANRARYEQATSSKCLPKQLFPLMTVHLAAYEGQVAIVKHALVQARAFGGVKCHHIVEIIDDAFIGSGGEAKMAALLNDEELVEMIEKWDE
jgi:hypothetical protein